MAKKVFITVTGTKYYYGKDFLEPKMKVVLKKDPDNEYDSEAIKVELEGLGQIGSVANSVGTVVGESMSAGRLYDKIGDTAEAEILYVLPTGILCVVDKESIVAEFPDENDPDEN